MCPLIRSQFEFKISRQFVFEVFSSLALRPMLSNLKDEFKQDNQTTKLALVSVEYSARRSSSEVKKYIFDLRYAKVIMKRYGNKYAEYLP